MRHSTRSEVDPFIVMDVMEAARQAEAAGRPVIHMEVGQPGTGAPAAARAALSDAMATDALGYTVALGLPDLRAGIAELYAQWYGVELDPARVIVTAGASGAFLLAFTSLFDAGDRVGLGEPGYPSYRQILRALSLIPVGLPTDMASRYQPVPQQVSADLAGLILASPANPTGTILDHRALDALAAASDSVGAALVSDEIYHGLHYENRAVSALEVTQNVYVINSFSKYFSMTGWRLGWMVVPPDHLRRVERLAQNMFICAPHAAQVAALGALTANGRAELDAHRDTYAQNRRVLMAGLAAAGLDRIAPADGAFYLYVDVSEFTQDSLAFAAEILREVDVAVTPGLDFDPARGARFLRLSYAAGREEIADGAARLAACLAARRGRGFIGPPGGAPPPPPPPPPP
ncbi:MAG: aminotransferase class I/II-fold pyridoxal phosphate-dependent enzyme, partial [Pseudomonadota bacterium]